jgi:hypothetical protein
VFGQNDYRKGYYIDNENKKFEIFLQYRDYSKMNFSENDSQNIKFKSAENGAVEKIAQSNVNEISIPGDFKFQRFVIPLLKSYSNEPIRELRNKSLFLKVLSEGEASLYSYLSKKKTIYFYKINNQVIPIELSYVDAPLDQSAKDKRASDGYKKELYEALKNETLKPSDFSTIGYNAKDLIAVFDRYNKLQGKENVILSNTISKSKLVFTGLVNLNNTSVVVANEYSSSDAENLFSVGIGAEAELRFNPKWGLFLKASVYGLDYSISTKESESNSVKRTSRIEVDMTCFDIIVSPRYHKVFNAKSELFFSLGLGVIISNGNAQEIKTTRFSIIEIVRDPLKLGLKTTLTVVPAVGYSFAKNYSVELQYYLNSDYFSNSYRARMDGPFEIFNADNNHFTLSLRYSFK